MTALSPLLRRTLQFALPALALAVAASPVAAQTAAFKPTVLHRFTGTADAAKPGGVPQAPPLLGTDGKLQGHTLLGGPARTFVIGQGAAYRIDTTAGASNSYTAQLLGDIGASTTTLVRDAQGVFHGGSAASNYLNDTLASPFGSTAAMFNIKAGMPTITGQPAIRPRGQIAIDGAGNIYLGGADAPTTCSATVLTATLWRQAPDGSYAKAIDFCQFSTTVGTTQIHAKGGAPVASVWSETDQALYVLTAVAARGVVDTSATADSAGRSFGTLVKISKATLDIGIASNGVVPAAGVEVLRTFLRNRDGQPSASGGRLTGLVEAGEWLYGTTYSNPVTTGNDNDTRYSGTLWRVKKTDPSTFAVLHYFRSATTLAADGTATADGGTPSGPLVVAADGNIYGTTARDGRTLYKPATGLVTPVGAGTIFRVVAGKAANRSDDAYEVLHRFDLATEGGRPVGLTAGAISGGVQKLYGAASNGGSGETTDATVVDASGNGTVYSIDIPLPTTSFTTALTASAATAKVGDTLRLSWATTNAASCIASGDNGGTWVGAQQVAGALVPLNGTLGKVGTNTFTLTCQSINGGPSATQTVSVAVEAPPVVAPSTDGGSGGGGGPLGALLLVPLAGFWMLRRQRASRQG